MAKVEDKVCVYAGAKQINAKTTENKERIQVVSMKLGVLGVFVVTWFFMARHYNSELLLPTPMATFKALFAAVIDPEVLLNLAITMKRVLTGFTYACAIGIPLGFLMGYSKLANKSVEGLIHSIRQVPIMAWVPLTIVWFGLGDGPTVFLIAFSGVFPIILNTIEGVRNISKDYYNAARSMGASRWSIFKDVIVPASIPDILTGSRIAISSGWMSVIWAEFIATSAGFGYSMVQAQTLMQTDMLIALMIMAAIVGFSIDSFLQFLNRTLTKWRYIQ